LPYKDPNEDFLKKISSFKYDGEYLKITQHHVDCECFCSNGDCMEEFELSEVIVKKGGNLYHRRCCTPFFVGQIPQVNKEMLDNQHFK